MSDNSTRLKFAISTLERYEQCKAPLVPLFLKPMFFYVLFVFLIYNIGLFDFLIFLKPIAAFFSNHIPLIDYYFSRDKIDISIMYSLFIIGILAITVKALLSKEITYFPIFGTLFEKIILLFVRFFSFCYLGLGVLVCLSEMMVVVQHKCPEIYKTARECMNVAATPESFSFHHLLLMMLAILFWSGAVASLVYGIVPKFILKKYKFSSHRVRQP
jgi:hypothetical protein